MMQKNIFSGLMLILVVFILPTLASGKCIQGNCINGQGKVTLAGVKTFEGTFINGRPQGQGKLTDTYGNVLIGSFNGWHPNGEHKLLCSNEQKLTISFPNSAYQKISEICENAVPTPPPTANEINEIFEAGWLYYRGEQNYIKSFEYAVQSWENAAQYGHAEAQYNLGWMLEKGQGITKSIKDAHYWYKKAAEQGNSRAQYALARLYESSSDIQQNITTAIKWHKLAAKQGHIKSQTALARIYEKGEGVPQDKVLAAKWYSAVAAQGNASDQYEIAKMYQDGKRILKNHAEAVKWYTLAAKQGHSTAQNNLAVMYSDGKEIQADTEKAIFWGRKAAEQGSAISQNNLGEYYLYQSSPSTEDYKEAIKWFKKAANQNNIRAMGNLAFMYKKGYGVPQNNKDAIFWYKQATDKGDANAQFELAWMYFHGKGVSPNRVIAHALLSLSHVNGHINAQKDKDAHVTKHLSPREIEQSSDIASDWYKSIEQGKSYKIPNLQTLTASPAQPVNKPVLSGSGSAFIITQNGYILTCYHVIEGASQITITTKDSEYPATLVRSDKFNDIALLKINGNFSPLSFASTNSVQMGSDVFTIGYPNPLMQGINQKLTEGTINSLTGYQDDIRLYQISVPIQPGNSGGALLNKDGDVIGMVVAILKSEVAFKVTGSLPQNVNYALKSAYIKTLINTVPEASKNLEKSNGHKWFKNVVKKTEKSVVMVKAYQ